MHVYTHTACGLLIQYYTKIPSIAGRSTLAACCVYPKGNEGIAQKHNGEKKIMTKHAGKQEPLYVSPTDSERTLSIQNIHLGICVTVIWGREFCDFQHSKARNGAKL